jgi:hypothetical protein
VFDCQVVYESRAYVGLDQRAASTAAPDDFADRLEPDLLAHVLTVTERFVPPGRTRRSLFNERGSYLPYSTVWMVFTDASNRRWQRSRTGRLSRLVESSTQPPRSRKDYMLAWIAGELDHLDY